MARRSQRSSHSRRQVTPPASFTNLFLLCGSMLLLLWLLSFLAGPLLVSHVHHHSESTAQEEVDLSVGGNDTRAILEENNQSTGGNDTQAVVGITKSSSKSIWTTKFSKYYYGCSEPSNSFLSQLAKSQSNGYLLIEASGGLNQQRTGIVDAAVVARILNATLVVPRLDHASFWKDSSNFSDIFSINQFITSLRPYVRIVQDLPRSMKGQEHKIPAIRIPRKCTSEYYKKKILPLLQKNKVLRLTKFDYRLANRLDKDLQKLRCKVNYHALQFTEAIRTMGNLLVQRMQQRNGRFIAIHLRFEPDMLAFTGCYYGGGEKEIKELGQLRKRWKNIPHLNPGKARRNGRCPLTPEEVGFMLRALGYSSDTYLYVASGEIYGGEKSLAPLKAMFPNFYTKDTLASGEELRPFSAFSSRMAAIDFIVCDESDVFVTNNNGNMARMLAGRRRYFGHKRTIRANAKKLASVFLAKPNMTWEAFAVRLKKLQKGFMGEAMEMRPGRGQFFENPSACICQMETQSETDNLRHHPDLNRDAEVHHADSSEDLGDTEDEQEQGGMDEYSLDSNHDQDPQKSGPKGPMEYTDTEEYSWLSE